MVFCQVCGKANTEDANFCFSCGTPISHLPPVKVEVKSLPSVSTVPTAPPIAPPPPIYAARQAPRQGSCYYHPDLPSMAVCSRCGRSICAGCTKPYGILNFCTECFHGLSARIGSSTFSQSQYQYQYPYQYQYVYPTEMQPQDQRRSLF